MQITTFKKRVINCALYVNGAKYCTIKRVQDFTFCPEYLQILPTEGGKMPYLVLKVRVKSARVQRGKNISICPAPYNHDDLVINF